jgi:hypothetical protein
MIFFIALKFSQTALRTYNVPQQELVLYGKSHRQEKVASEFIRERVERLEPF